VQYTALKELGLIGYIDHLMDKPRGILAFSVFIPLLMLVLHTITELVKPLSLSLRLRSNIMGDDLGMSIIAGMGLAWLPLLLMNTFLAIIACIVQALVFCLLSTVYFALVLPEEE
jgi:F0F1-type ATP synthase membrane subunit a